MVSVSVHVCFAPLHVVNLAEADSQRQAVGECFPVDVGVFLKLWSLQKTVVQVVCRKVLCAIRNLKQMLGSQVLSVLRSQAPWASLVLWWCSGTFMGIGFGFSSVP